jgi:hypothetical protein
MSDPLVGNILTDENYRDAIHVAIAPVEASEDLWPGDRIVFVDPADNTLVRKAENVEGIGLVDPYLKRRVKKGQRFWMFLMPRSIQSLHHHWTHPAFNDKPVDTQASMTQPVHAPSEEESEALMKALRAGPSINWMKNYVANNTDDEMTYDDLLGFADDWVNHSEYANEGGRFEGWGLPYEFWTHYEVIRGVVVPESKKTGFFSCAC